MPQRLLVYCCFCFFFTLQLSLETPKERVIYLPDVIFPWFYPKERIIHTPDGVFCWNHSDERMIILLQYTLYQKQHNVTWASMFFSAIAPSLASCSPFCSSILLHQAFSLSYWFPDRLLLISRAQAMCAILLS